MEHLSQGSIHVVLHFAQVQKSRVGRGCTPEANHGIDLPCPKFVGVCVNGNHRSLTQKSANPIAHHRTFGNTLTDADPYGQRSCELGYVALRHNDNNGTGVCPLSTTQYRVEGTKALQRLRRHHAHPLSGCANGKTVTTFGPAAVQHAAAILRSHTCTKTVCANTTAATWLIGAFHVLSTLRCCGLLIDSN